jgi:hypothetical protein
MAQGVVFNIFEKSIFCEFSDVTHAYLNLIEAYKKLSNYVIKFEEF